MFLIDEIVTLDLIPKKPPDKKGAQTFKQNETVIFGSKDSNLKVEIYNFRTSGHLNINLNVGNLTINFKLLQYSDPGITL